MHLGSLDKPLPASTARLDLSVNVPDACARLSGKVAHPKIVPGDDEDLLVLQYAAALETANLRIGARDDCVLDLVKRYRAAGKTEQVEVPDGRRKAR